MADVLLFGATGYTGTLTARSLRRRGASFVVCGRNRSKLDEVARETGASDVRVVEVGDVDGLVRALEGVRTLVTCVGPFIHLGGTAVEAALRARVNYIDSTGEGSFIARLIRNSHSRALEARIAMAPAMGFDEGPADVTAALATQGIDNADLVLTYAFPSSASRGTIRTSLDIAVSEGQWMKDGRPVPVRAGQEKRWAPMPPPLGPRAALAFPFAEGYLAPLHLELRSLKTFSTVKRQQELIYRAGVPLLRVALATPARRLIHAVVDRVPFGPTEEARALDRWTILGEARAGTSWRNVALSGVDPYGLTAELLAAAAIRMSRDGVDLPSGVLSPVQAMGLDSLEKELIDWGVTTQTFGHG